MVPDPGPRGGDRGSGYATSLQTRRRCPASWPLPCLHSPPALLLPAPECLLLRPHGQLSPRAHCSSSSPLDPASHACLLRWAVSRRDKLTVPVPRLLQWRPWHQGLSGSLRTQGQRSQPPGSLGRATVRVAGVSAGVSLDVSEGVSVRCAAGPGQVWVGRTSVWPPGGQGSEPWPGLLVP